MKKLWLYGLTLVIVFSMLFGLWSPRAVLAQKKPIKIGAIWPLTGPIAEEAIKSSAGFKMVIQDINAAGGLLGRPVEVIWKDSKTKPDVGAREARDLVYSDGVDFLAGTQISSVTLAVSEFAKESKKIFVNLSSKSKLIQEDHGHRYVFSPGGNTRSSAGSHAYVRAHQPYTKYALMCVDYAWGQSLAEDFERVLLSENPNAKIVKKLWPKLSERDFTPYITTLMASDAEVLYTVSVPADIMTLIKQAKPYGLFKKMSVGIYATQSIFEAMGKDMPEDMYADIEYYFSYPGKESEEFEKKCFARNGFHADSQAFNGWLCATTLVEGIKKAGTTETEAVVNALEDISFMTPLGIKNTIRACDHMGTVCSIVGKTKFVPQFPNWAILTDCKYPDPAKLVVSCDEVLKKRKAK